MRSTVGIPCLQAGEDVKKRDAFFEVYFRVFKAIERIGSNRDAVEADFLEIDFGLVAAVDM